MSSSVSAFNQHSGLVHFLRGQIGELDPHRAAVAADQPHSGFTTETLECDIRPGGRWRFIYTGPDGTRWDNRMVFLRIEAPRLIETEHGSDKDDDPTRFHVFITFDEQSDGKTVLTMRQLHPTKEQRDGGIAFGAVEFGYQTLDKLARHLGAG